MAAFSKLQSVLTQRRAVASIAGICLSWALVRRLSVRRASRKRGPEVKYVIGDKSSKKEKAAVDLVFFKRLFQLLKVLVPGLFTAEMFFVLQIAASLAARTYCDVWMIENGTSIESAIIGRNVDLFKKHLVKFMWAMPAISIINNVLKWGLNELKLRFRTRLSHYLYDQYLTKFTYYKMSNLDNRIANADQLLTQDVEKFCESVGELYSNLSKPLLDIVIYTAKLTRAIGIQGPTFMLGYLFVSGMILTRLRRPIGRFTVLEQKLEGEYRYINSRVITNSEEIAFYQGNKKEQTIVRACFEKLVNHLHNYIYFRFQMGFVDNIIAKYFATVVGYFVVSRPFLDLAHSRHLTTSHSERLEDYYQSGRMLVRMAEAIGRVVLAGREMTRLAGYTSRITEFVKVLKELNSGKYERTMVTSKQSSSNTDESQKTLRPGSGVIKKQDHIIKYCNVLYAFNIFASKVKAGVNVLVCGPNGCGKSSLFRILGELWPLFGGTLTKPDSRNLFYVPQRPYMALGTLRDQIIYPDSQGDQLRKGKSDKDLEVLMAKAQLTYILEREGWDSVQDWMDVLSGGEKQRIAMARLFYHKPQFAILDECTSAVSVDVEAEMYQYCRNTGITLFTVSHRKSLWQHHEYYLHMDGRGSFTFEPITSDTQEFGS